MAALNYLKVFEAAAAAAITLDGLAHSATAGRQATLLSNTGNFPSARLTLGLFPAAVHGAGGAVEVFLLRGHAIDGSQSIMTDNAGASDAAFTPVLAPLIESFTLDGAAAQSVVTLDTEALGPLGSVWAPAVRNNLGVALKAALVVEDATNATPIVITTTAAHGLSVGDFVVVADVGGNTAANGTWRISVVGAADTLTLEGSIGNGAYTEAGSVSPNWLRYEYYRTQDTTP